MNPTNPNFITNIDVSNLEWEAKFYNQQSILSQLISDTKTTFHQMNLHYSNWLSIRLSSTIDT